MIGWVLWALLAGPAVAGEPAPEVEAARASLAKLTTNPKHKGTRREAESRLVALVRTLDVDDPRAKLEAADRALPLLRRGRELGLSGPGPEAAETARDQGTKALIQRNLESAAAARDEGSFAAAVVRLDENLRLRPAHGPTLAALAETRRAWASAELVDGRPRDAAERLVRNGGLPGGPGDLRRAIEVYVQLAATERARGACRAAVADLERARKLDCGGEPGCAEAPPDLARRLDDGRSCAATWVDLVVTSDDPQARPGFAPRLRDRLGATATPHLTLADRGTPRLLPAGPEGPPLQEGPYRVEVLLTAPVVRVRPPRAAVKTVRESALARCVDPYGTPWPAPCQADLRITFEEIEEAVGGELVAIVRISDLHARGRQLAFSPVRVSATDAARWRGELLAVQTVTAGRVVSLPWRPATTAAARSREPRAAARTRLVTALNDQLVEAVAAEVRAVLDTEPPVPDRLE